MAEAEEEEVEEDALVLLLELPNCLKMTTKGHNRPLLQSQEEAVAKSLNYPLLKWNSKMRSHWNYQSLKKNLHQRKVVEKEDNQLQPNRILSNLMRMKRCSPRLPEEERRALVEPEEEAKHLLLPNVREPQLPGEVEARKSRKSHSLKHNMKR